MTPCTATACKVELKNGITLCHEHTTQLEEALREVPSAWQSIYVSACKLDVGAGSVGGMGGEASGSEPANLDALDKAETLEAVLRGWAGQISVVSPRFDAPKIAVRLYGQLPWIRRQDWAGDLLQELRDALNACAHTTDRAGSRVFAGICPTIDDDGTPCNQPLYALSGRPYSRCRGCSQEWDVSDWRERALTAAELHTGTAAEISRMLSDPVTREALPQDTIRKWAKRGKLEPVSCDLATKRSQYIVADVRSLWVATKAAGYKRAQLVA